MRYQLVLQFIATPQTTSINLWLSRRNFTLELASMAVVDGHDFGLSEFNIFILTDEPAMVFDKAHRIVRDQRLHQGLRAAYRESAGEDYVILWPSTLTEFTVS